MLNRSINSVAALHSEISTKTRVNKCDWQSLIRNPVFEHFWVSQRKEWYRNMWSYPVFHLARGHAHMFFPPPFPRRSFSSISIFSSAYLAASVCLCVPELNVMRNLAFLFTCTIFYDHLFTLQWFFPLQYLFFFCCWGMF